MTALQGYTATANAPTTTMYLNTWSAGTSSNYTFSGSTNVTGWDDATAATWDAKDALDVLDGLVALPKRELRYELPDGSVLHVDAQGNFRLDDAQAQVIYKANRNREFNPYVNASDLIARFIAYVGSLGLRREEVGTLPLALLVNWLVVEAATQDGDPVPADVVPVPAHRLLRGRTKPRCLACQRYVRRAIAAQGFAYCRPACATRHGIRLLGEVA